MISDVGLPLGRTRGVLAEHGAALRATCWSTWCRGSSGSARDVQAAEAVRGALRDAMPGTQVYFFIGGIVKRILNFGSPAPDRRRDRRPRHRRGRGLRQAGDRARCGALDDKGKPLLSDLQITREENYPELDVVVDRAEGGQAGLSEQQVAQTVLTSLVGQHAVRAHPVHRREDRQRVLHQRAAGRATVTRRRPGRAVRAHAAAAGWWRSTPSRGRARQRPGGHQPQVPAAHRRRHGQRRAGHGPGRRQRGRAEVLDELPPPEGSASTSAARPRRSRRRSATCRSRRSWRSCSSTWCWRRSSSR